MGAKHSPRMLYVANVNIMHVNNNYITFCCIKILSYVIRKIVANHIDIMKILLGFCFLRLFHVEFNFLFYLLSVEKRCLTICRFLFKIHINIMSVYLLESSCKSNIGS